MPLRGAFQGLTLQSLHKLYRNLVYPKLLQQQIEVSPQSLIFSYTNQIEKLLDEKWTAYQAMLKSKVSLEESSNSMSSHFHSLSSFYGKGNPATRLPLDWVQSLDDLVSLLYIKSLKELSTKRGLIDDNVNVFRMEIFSIFNFIRNDLKSTPSPKVSLIALCCIIQGAAASNLVDILLCRPISSGSIAIACATGDDNIICNHQEQFYNANYEYFLKVLLSFEQPYRCITSHFARFPELLSFEKLCALYRHLLMREKAVHCGQGDGEFMSGWTFTNALDQIRNLQITEPSQLTAFGNCPGLLSKDIYMEYACLVVKSYPDLCADLFIKLQHIFKAPRLASSVPFMNNIEELMKRPLSQFSYQHPKGPTTDSQKNWSRIVCESFNSLIFRNSPLKMLYLMFDNFLHDAGCHKIVVDTIMQYHESRDFNMVLFFFQKYGQQMIQALSMEQHLLPMLHTILTPDARDLEKFKYQVELFSILYFTFSIFWLGKTNWMDLLHHSAEKSPADASSMTARMPSYRRGSRSDLGVLESDLHEFYSKNRSYVAQHLLLDHSRKALWLLLYCHAFLFPKGSSFLELSASFSSGGIIAKDMGKFVEIVSHNQLGNPWNRSNNFYLFLLTFFSPHLRNSCTYIFDAFLARNKDWSNCFPLWTSRLMFAVIGHWPGHHAASKNAVPDVNLVNLKSLVVVERDFHLFQHAFYLSLEKAFPRISFIINMYLFRRNLEVSRHLADDVVFGALSHTTNARNPGDFVAHPISPQEHRLALSYYTLYASLFKLLADVKSPLLACLVKLFSAFLLRTASLSQHSRRSALDPCGIRSWYFDHPESLMAVIKYLVVDESYFAFASTILEPLLPLDGVAKHLLDLEPYWVNIFARS